jgi:hypothetical protein
LRLWNVVPLVRLNCRPHAWHLNSLRVRYS